MEPIVRKGPFEDYPLPFPSESSNALVEERFTIVLWTCQIDFAEEGQGFQFVNLSLGIAPIPKLCTRRR